jgi:hypothetical protein
MAPTTASADAMFHCTQCAQFLPLSQFYASSVLHSIHRCRKHTRIAARASWRKTLSRMSPERKAAHRVAARMSKVASSPAWTRAPSSVVEGVLRRFDCRSVLSGRTRGLVLVPVRATVPVTGTEWQAWESVPVTQGEAAMLATQTDVQREAMLCRGAVGEALQAARCEAAEALGTV